MSVHIWYAVVTDINLLIPAEYIISFLPDTKTFGRACKYINDPFLMMNLKWKNPNTVADQRHQEKLKNNFNMQTKVYNLQPKRTNVNKLLTFIKILAFQ